MSIQKFFTISSYGFPLAAATAAATLVLLATGSTVIEGFVINSKGAIRPRLQSLYNIAKAVTTFKSSSSSSSLSLNVKKDAEESETKEEIEAYLNLDSSQRKVSYTTNTKISKGSIDPSAMPKETSNFDTIIQSRRTINNFLPNLPDNWEQSIETAIESAIYAPNHKRTEPWNFYLLGPQTIQKICELNSQIVSEKKGKIAGKKKLERWLNIPGWLVVTCKTKIKSKTKKDIIDKTNVKGSNRKGEKVLSIVTGVGDTMDNPASIQREDYAAVCCSIQNLCLSLHNSGLGTKWTTGEVNFDKRFHTIVDLEIGEYVVGTIWFGTPENAPSAPPKKKMLDTVLKKRS